MQKRQRGAAATVLLAAGITCVIASDASLMSDVDDAVSPPVDADVTIAAAAAADEEVVDCRRRSDAAADN